MHKNVLVGLTRSFITTAHDAIDHNIENKIIMIFNHTTCPSGIIETINPKMAKGNVQ